MKEIWYYVKQSTIKNYNSLKFRDKEFVKILHNPFLSINNLHLVTMEMTKKEIIDRLESQSRALRNWFLDKPIEKMEFAPEGVWTAGQHLLHLIKSTKPLGKRMGYPRILLLLKFGRVKHPSRSYENTIKSYTDALDKGGKATGEFVPREVKKSEREALVGRFRDEMAVLTNQVHQWSEKNLDNTNVPHPLIGNLTLREMLYFTIYHMEHHLKILEERYS
jgi:hypothetical protein